MLVIAGGQDDPNITGLCRAAVEGGFPHQALLVGPDAHPRLHWDLENNELQLAGTSLNPTAILLRYDVFASMRDPRQEVSRRASSWFTTLSGYAQSHRQTRMFNKHASPIMGNKPAMLVRAREAGLAIPRTRISNDVDHILACQPAETHIAKPVDGGGYCLALPDALRAFPHHDGAAASPAIVQERLVPPELRIYRIGSEFLAYDMDSPDLDYRVRQSATVRPVEVPAEIATKQAALMDELEMDFGAADYKTDPTTGELVFLELNSSPMFAHFDQVSEGALCRAMLSHMTT